MIKKLNNRLLFILIIFMFISLILINSSTLFTNIDNIVLKQFIWYIIGFSLIPLINHIKINKYTYLFLYLFNLVLLGIVLIYGEVINGSKCWILIPKIGSFQPSEFMKVSLILLGSKIATNYKSDIKFLLSMLLVFIPPIILTFLEPDTGSVIMYLIIGISILFISPLKKRWWIIIGIIFIISLSTIIYILLFNKELFIHIFGENIFYRINRVLDWKNKTGMQLENSLVAIGSAGIFGYGYLKTPIYFPESSTDFIFSHLVSNFGVLVAILFIILLVIFNLTLLKIISKTNNKELKYLVFSTLAVLLFSQIENIGMTLGILPIIGIPLPFISYGGSSIISYFLIIGIILKEKKCT